MFEDRVHKVLRAIIDSYISNPDPVGSRFITKKYDFSLSPATIRNIMADLEELGFLSQPHTSAGRIPTDKGYRFYVDWIAQQENRTDALLVNELTKRLETIRKDINTFFNEATQVLAKYSHYLGVAVTPRFEQSILSRISLFQHRRNHIALTLLTDEGIMHNRMLGIDPDITQRDLSRITDYLNTEFSGHTIAEIKEKIIKEMQEEKALCDKLISRALNICRDALGMGYHDVFISGFSEVLRLPDFADLERIKGLSKTLEDKHLIIRVLDTLSDSEGVKVLIGSENAVMEMKNLSVVMSTYREGDRSMGSIGIIGPTRMDYVKAITVVNTIAEHLTKILSKK